MPNWQSAADVLDYYRGLVAGGADYVGYSEPTLKRTVIAVASRLPGERVVELGCGPNPVVPFALARQGRKVTGVELSTDFVETARLNADRQGVSIELVNAPAHETGLPDGCTDIVIMTEVLEHIPDEYELPTLREARRLLADDGRFIISVPNWSGWTRRYFAWRNGFDEHNEEHLRKYTVPILRARLQEAGFAPERALRVPSTDQPPWKTRVAWLIDRIAVRPEWSLKAAIVARKS